jgi:hypothetical protein
MPAPGWLCPCRKLLTELMLRGCESTMSWTLICTMVEGKSVPCPESAWSLKTGL